MDREAIVSRITKINWQREKDIYVHDLPLSSLCQLEWLWPRLNFEIRVHGRQVSPDWYVSELVLQAISENAKEAYESLVGRVTALYQSWIDKATKAGLPWVAAAFLAREAEYWWGKLDYHRSKLRAHWDDLSSTRKIKGLPWPELEFGELEAARERRRGCILDIMSSEATILNLAERPKDYPDFAGQFLHMVGEAIFSAMDENDEGTVKDLFERFFLATFAQFEKLRPLGDIDDWRVKVELKIAVAPVLDLMELSGYALLYADYYDNLVLSAPIITTWNAYLDQARIEFLAAAIRLTDSLFGLPHRATIRTAWGRRVNDRLRSIPRAPHSLRNGLEIPDIHVQHQSPLVRIFARDPYGTMHDGIDIFIAKHIRAHEHGQDINFGRRRRLFEEALRREEERALGREP